MSNRVFRGFTEDSSSDYLKNHINRGTVHVTKKLNKDCYRFKLCFTASIQNYNTLRNLETLYNDKTKNNENYYFNGKINQANFLQSNINSENIIVKQLVTDLSNAMTLSLNTSTGIDVSNENLFSIDPSGILYIPCSNIFFTQNSNVSYTLQNTINGITPRFKITNKLHNPSPPLSPPQSGHLSGCTHCIGFVDYAGDPNHPNLNGLDSENHKWSCQGCTCIDYADAVTTPCN